MSEGLTPTVTCPAEKHIADMVVEATDSPRMRAMKKFGHAAVGAIPWVGGFLAAYLEYRDKGHTLPELHRQWLELHAEKLEELRNTLESIGQRLNSFGDEINERVESPEFLGLVDKGFRTWDSASTKGKRENVRRLLANAAATTLCSDDLVRLFLDWINRYDDTHFNVMKAVYNHSGITRRRIWLSLHPSIPRDDSSEADLFKLLIHDLTLGHVLRQERETTHDGRFMKKQPVRKAPPGSAMKSPFDDEQGYELTELGGKFIHYVMEEVVPRVKPA